MGILSNTYSAAVAAYAANMPPATLQNWLKRDLIVGHRGVEGGGSQGRHRRFSFEAVMQLAVAKALIDGGLADVRKATEAGARFAHEGHGSVSGKPRRNPGMPYHHNHGETWMIVSGDHSRIVLADDKGRIAPEREFPQKLRSFAYITLNASGLFDSVCAALGAHPNEVLDAAYPEDAT